MHRQAPVPCPVQWQSPQSSNEVAAGAKPTTHSCGLPVEHLHWPSAVTEGQPVPHMCACGTSLPVRDVEPAL